MSKSSSLEVVLCRIFVNSSGFEVVVVVRFSTARDVAPLSFPVFSSPTTTSEGLEIKLTTNTPYFHRRQSSNHHRKSRQPITPRSQKISFLGPACAITSKLAKISKRFATSRRYFCRYWLECSEMWLVRSNNSDKGEDVGSRGGGKRRNRTATEAARDRHRHFIGSSLLGSSYPRSRIVEIRAVIFTSQTASLLSPTDKRLARHDADEAQR
ncbi:hypothetical protein BJ508DRAFT_307750 [Ascobolus immersus RN42]|uniref:Uncharacterized protein n=1 Tax=Ascobolus immersus RN42 TaxID=1160509 RepID=A0A3N4I783_ASCIM|nr:hypothetical protein BJ508DRAFT_307750 [Ascobolus immersus RN42]